jgi:hypothetical protein
VAKGRAREARWRSIPPHIESQDHLVDPKLHRRMTKMTKPQAFERARSLLTAGMIAAAAVFAAATGTHAQSAVQPLQLQRLSPAERELQGQDLQYQQPVQIQNQQQQLQMNLQQEQQDLMRSPSPQPFQVQPQLRP